MLTLRPSTPQRRGAVKAVVALALCNAASAVAAISFCAYQWRLYRALHDAHPTGDLAVFETNVRMALEGIQRFGPYSQGFRHPGPAYFYFLALPYALFGRSTFSLYFGAQALTLGFILLAALTVSRSFKSYVPTLAFVPIVLLELSYLGDFPLFDFWPPYVLFLGYAAFLLVAAALAAGRVAALAPFVLLGSFLIQTHIGYTLPVSSAALVALALCVRARRELPPFRGHVLAALGVVAAMWCLPLYAELVEGAGNARTIARTFVEQSATPWRLRGLFDRVALELTGPLQFAFFQDRFIVPEAPKHFFAARLLCVAELWGLAIAWKRARARADRHAESLCAVSVAAVVIAPIALAGIRGQVAPHHTAWISAIGTVVGLAIATGFDGLPKLRDRLAAPAQRELFLAGAFAIVTLVRPISIIEGIHRNPEVAVLADAAVRVVQGAAPAGVRVDWPGRSEGEVSPASELGVGVALELEKRGARVSTSRAPALAWMLGSKRWEHADEWPTVVVTSGSATPPGTELSCVARGDNYFLRYPLCAWHRGVVGIE